MTTSIIFSIIELTEPRQHWGPLLPTSKFVEIFQFSLDMGITPNTNRPPRIIFTINCTPNHHALPKLFEMLRELGWRPYYGYVQADTPGLFGVRVVREYEPAELAAAELLYLAPKWGSLTLTGCAGRQGDRWIGQAWLVDESEDEEHGWEAEAASIDGRYNYFVNGRLRSALEIEQLQGLRFHPLLWDEPERARADFWEIDTPFRMPPCLLPVVPADGDVKYEEGGYEPVELRFRREAVGAMGPFDLAWCREKVGKVGSPNHCGSVLVVSQRFREVCERLGIAAGYRIVRLE